MYHTIVKRITTKNFTRVNDRDFDGLLASCSPDIHHQFGGRHALGGERHDREVLRQWFERLARLFPNLVLTPQDVWVKGWPHRTSVIIRWTSSATLPDGTAYTNRGVHIISMRWGKAIAIDAHENSQAVAEALATTAESGVSEALSEPLVS